MTKDQNSRVVLISGAAGGIGSAAARRFAADGARVAVTDRAEAPLSELAAELGGLAVPADGTTREAIAGVVGAVVEELGRIDAVVAAQGATIPGLAGPKGDDAWLRGLEVNLGGAYYLTTECMPHLVESEGSIVAIASLAAIFSGPPGTIGYTAAKTGVVGLVRYLAREFGPKGVRANAICPGWVRTALAEDGMVYWAKREGVTPEDAYRAVTRHVPLRRVSEPEDIASVCAFLTSSDAGMITGQAITVDGGTTVMDPGTAMFDPPDAS